MLTVLMCSARNLMTSWFPTLALASCLLASACGENTHPHPQTPARPVAAPAPRERLRAATRPATTRPGGGIANHVIVTAAAAQAAGLPPVGFSLSTADAAWTVRKFPGRGVFVQLSGPPGGPLSLSVQTYPRPRASGSTLLRWILARFSKPFHRPLTIQPTKRFAFAGLPRPAVSFTSGSSMARTAYCAVLVASATTPPIEFVVLFGHGAPRGQPDCDAIAKHPSVAPVLASFKLLP